ncbi:MAG: hypothetical protein Q8Q42_02835 [Nanoarchaeota archaeon]|nr:hypothetical protein [Nanoarchaeota archaeon]
MKKGQVYILAVIVIGFLIFTIITPSNLLHQKIIDDDFQSLSRNYQVESAKLLNELLNKKIVDRQLIENTFLNFTVSFTSYSKTKNPNFGLIYAFPFENYLFIGNYADIDVNFTVGSSTISLEGCFNEVSTSVTLYGISIDQPDINPILYQDCIQTVGYPPTNQLEFTIEDVDYTFELNEKRSDIIIVSRETLDNEIKVFISE